MDYYKTLGVNKQSSPDEIKKAYRKLASQHHPDKGGDTAMFQKIEEAYRILSDPQKRQEYDNPRPQFTQGHGPFGFHFQGESFDINDLFGQMFRQHQPQQSRQQVFRTSVNITLEQSYNGGEHHMQLQLPTMNKMVKIEIPKGVPNGGQVKIENVVEGASLVVEFRVAKHLKYDRSGNDLISTHMVSVLDLIVGGSFEFTTINGQTLEVTIKPKTQPFMQLKITGKGMPLFGSHNHYGDQIILLKPFIPDIIEKSIIDSIVQSKSNKEKI